MTTRPLRVFRGGAGGNTVIARAAEAAWLRSLYKETKREQSKHAINIQIATVAEAHAHRGGRAAHQPGPDLDSVLRHLCTSQSPAASPPPLP
jgi:hypothetical protein